MTTRNDTAWMQYHHPDIGKQMDAQKNHSFSESKHFNDLMTTTGLQKNAKKRKADQKIAAENAAEKKAAKLRQTTVKKRMAASLRLPGTRVLKADQKIAAENAAEKKAAKLRQTTVKKTMAASLRLPGTRVLVGLLTLISFLLLGVQTFHPLYAQVSSSRRSLELLMCAPVCPALPPLLDLSSPGLSVARLVTAVVTALGGTSSRLMLC